MSSKNPRKEETNKTGKLHTSTLFQARKLPVMFYDILLIKS